MKNQKIKIEPIYKGEIFKENQFVKCINNEHISFNFNSVNDDETWDDAGERYLKVGKMYKVKRLDNAEDRGRLFIEVGKYDIDWFYPDRFISLQWERKTKLKKLKELL